MAAQRLTHQHQRNGTIANELTGLGRGGQQVQKCKETYIKAMETLVELASLQVSVVFLLGCNRTVNRTTLHSPDDTVTPYLIVL
jgi:V-type H+-transporting ATPase subunit D